MCIVSVSPPPITHLHGACGAGLGESVSLHQVHVEGDADEVLDLRAERPAARHAQLETPAEHLICLAEDLAEHGRGAALLKRGGARGERGLEEGLDDGRLSADRGLDALLEDVPDLGHGRHEGWRKLFHGDQSLSSDQG